EILIYFLFIKKCLLEKYVAHLLGRVQTTRLVAGILIIVNRRQASLESQNISLFRNLIPNTGLELGLVTYSSLLMYRRWAQIKAILYLQSLENLATG
ncbi:hypothetical protein, partial [Salmonella sp. s51228]|uniref:hypothetical protein n=1 Tax=Salmonella sp. s51228 TaxID=3159652 RepID=UPI00397F1E66